MNPAEMYTSHLDLIAQVVRFVCRRNQISDEDAGDFTSHVHLRCLEDDYAIFRKFLGNSSLRTYLVTVIHRWYQDYRNKHWGKWRASTAAKKLGAVAVHLETLIHRDGLDFHPAAETLRTNHGVPLSVNELEDLASQLPPRQPRQQAGDGLLAHLVDERAGPDDRLIQNEERQHQARMKTALAEALSRLQAEERLIIKMHFQDRFTLAQVARSLNHDQKKLYKRVAQILAVLRAQLEDLGMGVKA